MGFLDKFRRVVPEDSFRLPKEAKQLAKVTDALRKRFDDDRGFAPSGRIVGDIGEQAVCRLFGLERARVGNGGYDAIAPDKRTVQVKSTQNGGARFSYHEVGADHLICVGLDLHQQTGIILYNGPEAPVRAVLGNVPWNGTSSISRNRLLKLDSMVAPADRLPINR